MKNFNYQTRNTKLGQNAGNTNINVLVKPPIEIFSPEFRPSAIP